MPNHLKITIQSPGLLMLYALSSAYKETSISDAVSGQACYSLCKTPGPHHVADRGIRKKAILFDKIERNDFIARLANVLEDVNIFLLLTGHKT
jgi:hypothetical protein